jgi:thioredoxin reductase (NADPH)
LLLEKQRIGGLLWDANLVENYPGFPDGIRGPELAGLFCRQMERLGVEALLEEATVLDVEAGSPVIATRSNTYTPKVVLVASGTRPRTFPLEIPANLQERVLSSVVPILGVVDAHVVIIGGGDAALDYALNLIAHNAVTILNRGTQVQGLPLLWERAQSAVGFSYRDDTVVTQITTAHACGGLSLQCESRGTRCTIAADFVIFALGREPELSFMSSRARQTEANLVERGQLHFIGDVRNGLFRQTAIAAGDGLRAAMHIYGSARRA